MKRSLLLLRIPLREPFVTAGGVMAARELVLLRLEDEDGGIGYGEGAPLESYDGVTARAVAQALRGERSNGPPQARAAEEMALLDLEASRTGRPLGEPGADAIPVNRTLPAGPPEETARAATEALREGYSCFKVKVGLPDDLERVAAVMRPRRYRRDALVFHQDDPGEELHVVVQGHLKVVALGEAADIG